MKVGEMSFLGIAILKSNKDGKSSVGVEWHKCDLCGTEYRVYFRSQNDIEEAYQELAGRFGNRPGEEDLCFHCQNNVITDQAMLPLKL